MKLDKKIKVKKKRYEGLKPKLIHLNPHVFNMLEMAAKMSRRNLKEYIEILCTEQAKIEFDRFDRLSKKTIKKDQK